MISKLFKSIGLVLLVIILFVIYLVFNTLNFKSSQIEVSPIEEIKTPNGALDRITEALSYRTISYEEQSDMDSIQFKKFNTFLSKSYPLLHSKTEHKIFNEFSHLFKWKGKNNELDPIILMGHLDVVPIASLPAWTVHPFDEGIKNDTIYGRGTLDDKGSLISILEAAEQLMSEGYQPNRTIYFAMGHDEEVLGKYGAVEIAKYLEQENVNAAYVLDEGGVITTTLKDIQHNVALIGIAEKGFLSLELTVNLAGGHSSMPEKETSIDVLATAISTLKKNPPKAKMTETFSSFIEKLGPEYPFMHRILFANKNLFGPIIVNILSKSNSGNAMVRTTTSPTIIDAGIKENVIPTSARAVVNFRILPGETIDSVIEHVKNTIDDERITVTKIGSPSNPSAISPSDNNEFKSIEKSIKEVYPEVVITPYLVLGATDSRHYKNITDNIYRFQPFKITSENISCIHGIDERIGVDEYKDAIRFYRQIILNSN